MAPTRAEFLHIPAWQQGAFYLLMLACAAYAAYRLFERSRLWRKGKPIDWKPDWLANVWRYALGQRKVQSSRPRSGAPMHLMLFYGFLALVLATTLLAINTYSPLKFHKGLYYLVYEAAFDSLGLLFIIGVAWALVRRAFFRPISTAHAPQDLYVLGLLLLVGLTGYIVEAARIGNNPQPWDAWSPVGYAVAKVLPPISNGAYMGIWWFHAALVAAFFVSLPHLRIKHLVLAFLSAAGTPDRPMGRLAPIRMEEVEETGQVGVAHPREFSRWHLLSLDACMECGRCTEVCPANGVGKPLDPKQVAQGVLASLEENQPVLAQVSEEAIWACTTCNACVEACPVLVRHVDLIVDARRNLVAEGRLSGTAAVMLRQTASSSHAWGAPAGAREDWMKGLAVPLAREKNVFDVLLWVGCAGATDPGAVKTTRAIAELFVRAGVDFACLGTEERCTGDAARRVGDEFMFQELAGQNVATLSKYRYNRIVTACPHCLNTLRHEYGDFGANLRVQHHTQYLLELVEAGKLQAAPQVRGQTTYHDPCYLARANGESDAPRRVLGDPGGLNDDRPEVVQWLNEEPADRNLAEPAQRGKKTLCCGAGGGRMWMDEPPEQRPGDRRAAELLETGASTVAVGCPFCRIMLDSSLKQVSDRPVRLADVAELLKEAN